MSKKREVETDPNAEAWLAAENERWENEVLGAQQAEDEAKLQREIEAEEEKMGVSPEAEMLPPKCDECASFDCENCPARYEGDEDE